MFLLSFPLSLPFDWTSVKMLSMCLLFCFVVFWMLCCVMCEKKNVDNKKRSLIQHTSRYLPSVYVYNTLGE